MRSFSRLLCVCGPAELLPPEDEPIRAHVSARQPRGGAEAAAGARARVEAHASARDDVGWGQADDADEGADEGDADATATADLNGLFARADGAGVRRNDRQAQLLDKLE